MTFFLLAGKIKLIHPKNQIMSPKLPWKPLFLIWTGHLLMDFFTGIWPIYKTMVGLDLAIAGVIASVTGIIGESLQLFFGYFSDKGHRKKIFISGLVLASLVLFISFFTNYYALFGLILLLMLGSACFHPSAAGAVSLLSGEKKGIGILFFASGGAVGLGFSQLIFTQFLAKGLSPLLIFAPLFAFIGFVLFYRFPEEKGKAIFSLRYFIEPILKRKRTLLLLFFAQMTNWALTASFIFILPDLLKSRDCHSWICNGGGHLCFILGSACSMIFAGMACDKWGHKKILLSTLSLAIFFLYFFLNASSVGLWQTIVLLATLGSVLGILNPIIISWGNKVAPEHPSTVSGLLMGCAWSFGHFGPAATGLLITYVMGTPGASLSLMGILLCVSFGLVLFIPRQQVVQELT